MRSFTRFLRQLQAALSRRAPARRRRPRAGARLFLEFLEDRLAPTVNTVPIPSGTLTLGDSMVTLNDQAFIAPADNGGVLFRLYHNPNPTAVDTESAIVTGSGMYSTPLGYTLPKDGTAVTGLYQWDAVYTDPGNPANSASDINNPGEQVTIAPASPSITTTPSPTSITLTPAPSALTDSATLAGGYFPTGTLKFTLLDPNNVGIYSNTIPVNGNGTYNSTDSGSVFGSAVPTMAGTYTWLVAYSGDFNNQTVPSATNSETVLVSPAITALPTQPGGTLPIGSSSPLSDSANLIGGFNPTGTITFTLYNPGGGIAYTNTIPVSGNGTYGTSAPSTAMTSIGTYQWTASYSGDANNQPVPASTLGAEPETVSPATLNIMTTASPPTLTLPTTAPATLTDSVQVTGTYHPTGSLVFTLTEPSGTTVSVYTPLTGDGNYGAGVSLPTSGIVAGTYTWTVTYAGDLNNNPASDQSGSAEQTVVYPASPSITTTASPAVAVIVTGATLTDSAVVAGSYFASGNLMFTLSGPNGYSSTQSVALAGNGTYTARVNLPTGAATGTYTWSVQYLGDGNNNSATDQGGTAEQTTAIGSGVTVVGTTLYVVGGATTNDHININPGPPPAPVPPGPGPGPCNGPGPDHDHDHGHGPGPGPGPGIQVSGSLNGVNVNTQVQPPISAIVVIGYAGNDNIDIDRLTIPTTITLGNGNNNIAADDANTSVAAGNGNNQVQLGNGNDTIVLGTGNNHVRAGDGTDTVVAGALGSAATDNIQLGDGNGDSVTVLGNGNEQVQLGDGNGDVLNITGSGNEHIQVGNGHGDVLNVAGSGTDNIQTGNGSGTLNRTGGGGHDHVHLGGTWTEP